MSLYWFGNDVTEVNMVQVFCVLVQCSARARFAVTDCNDLSISVFLLQVCFCYYRCSNCSFLSVFSEFQFCSTILLFLLDCGSTGRLGAEFFCLYSIPLQPLTPTFWHQRSCASFSCFFCISGQTFVTAFIQFIRLFRELNLSNTVWQWPKRARTEIFSRAL